MNTNPASKNFSFDQRFCALEAKTRGESLPGKAEIAHTFLLIEDPNAWSGKSALQASSLSEKARLRVEDFDRCVLAPRILFIKNESSKQRHDRSIFICRPGGLRPRVRRIEIDSLEGLGEVDLVQISRDLEQSDHVVTCTSPLLLVCTHGKKDKCCAKIGGPLVQTLHGLNIEAWECTHTGGDRFAGNVIDPIRGHYYGFVYSDYAEEFALKISNDWIPLQHFRGATYLGAFTQAAEVHLRIANSIERTGQLSSVLRTVVNLNTMIEHFYDWENDVFWAATINKQPTEQNVLSGCSVGGSTNTFSYNAVEIRLSTRNELLAGGVSFQDGWLHRPVFREDLTKLLAFPQVAAFMCLQFPCDPAKEADFFDSAENSKFLIKESRSGEILML